jgi:hypothetical protein
VREDFDKELRIFDGSDDLQAATTARAVFDVDIEYALEHTWPTRARRRAMRVISGVLGCLLRWTGNDRSTRRGVEAIMPKIRIEFAPLRGASSRCRSTVHAER